MSKPKFKTAYGDRQRVMTEPKGESLTQQHFAHEADVRNIIKQYDKTGLIANVQKGVAQYGDYSEVNEYREALDLVNEANGMFAELPAELREMFQNNPGTFLEFATNPENNQKMIELGLKEAPYVQEEKPIMAENKAAEPPAPQEAGE
ncbi:MAG: internal scaffolding protein [Microviridae sp.]|nr:MAG: internal scaffolding protein [Microviridae sp.]